MIVEIAAITSKTTKPYCHAVLPLKKAFENAMTMDIAMGGSTNTILHLLAVANKQAWISKWPTSTACRPLHLQNRAQQSRLLHGDVHRAGSIFAILKELDKTGKLHTDVDTIHAPTLKDAIENGT